MTYQTSLGTLVLVRLFGLAAVVVFYRNRNRCFYDWMCL